MRGVASPRLRAAVTLVEVMVAMAVGMVLLTGLQDFLFRGTALLESSHQNLEAATSAQLLVERIHADIRRVHPSDSIVASGTLKAGPPFSMEVSTTGGGVETITYDLVAGPAPGTSYVSRNGRVLRAVVLKELSIQTVTHTNPTTLFELWGIQTILLATDGQGKKDFALVDFTAIDSITRRAADPYWVPNPP